LTLRLLIIILLAINRIATGASDEKMVVDHFGGFNESGWLCRGF
jgi:hypothetical protein